MIVGISSTTSHGQPRKTIVLVRHAEKEISDDADPHLSGEGLKRAERLVEKIKKYKPGAIYSTNYIRTSETVAPMAKHRKLAAKIYDPKKQGDLVAEVLSSKTKRFLIVGHSNTIPILANLLLKKDLFKSLDESEYGTIWIIRIKNGKTPSLELFEY